MKKVSRFQLMCDEETAIENKDGVEFCDLFVLYYCGIYVFFDVCFEDYDQVAVYERKNIYFEQGGKKWTTINFETYAGARKPLVVKGSNCWSKGDFYLKTITSNGKAFLEVPVIYDDPLYKLALEMGEIPDTGIFYAEKIDRDPNGGYNYKFEIKKFPPRKRVLKLDNLN